MPKVSILIPAYRPDFLDASVASALAQTFRDFELLIGDDSAGDDVASVLSKWSDPRIVYTRNPNRGTPGTNRNMLISQASGQYIKFLFDDDLLLPESVAMLCAAADSTHAALAFHAHYVIDSIGRTKQWPTPIPADSAALVTRDQLFDTMIQPAVNFIGGPVNTLISTEALAALPNPFGIGTDRMRFLTDMALYTNFADQGHQIVGLGKSLSAFRIHDRQASSASSPIHSAGVFEWEYLARWTADHWSIEYSRCIATIQARHQWYEGFVARYPQLRRLTELGSQPDASGAFFTAEFQEAINECWTMIAAGENKVGVIE